MVNKHDGNEGFTLLELSIAVGILLILSVGGMAAYGDIMGGQRKDAVALAAMSVGTNAEAYLRDFDDTTTPKQAEEEWTAEQGNAVVQVSVSEEENCARVVAKDAHGNTAKRNVGDWCDGHTPPVETPYVPLPVGQDPVQTPTTYTINESSNLNANASFYITNTTDEERYYYYEIYEGEALLNSGYGSVTPEFYEDWGDYSNTEIVTVNLEDALTLQSDSVGRYVEGYKYDPWENADNLAPALTLKVYGSGSPIDGPSDALVANIEVKPYMSSLKGDETTSTITNGYYSYRTYNEALIN